MCDKPIFGKQGKLDDSMVSHSKFPTVPIDPLFRPSRYAFATVPYGNWHDKYDPLGTTPHWSPDDAQRPFESIPAPENALQASSEQPLPVPEMVIDNEDLSPCHDLENMSRSMVEGCNLTTGATGEMTSGWRKRGPLP